MSVAAAVIAPHAPVLIPEIGGDRIEVLRRTTTALEAAARAIDLLAPETLVFISPHGPVAGRSFAMAGGRRLTGAFSRFGFPETGASVDNDTDLAAAVAESILEFGLGTSFNPDSEAAVELDQGVLVPYHFLGGGRPIISITVSVDGYESHFKLGQAVAAGVRRLGRRVVLVASGDLSHRLSLQSPYGFSPAGPEFDRRLVELCSLGALNDLALIDPELRREAAECGMRSFAALAGSLDGRPFTPRVLSYEGPLGVGYLVADFVPEEEAAGNYV